MRKSKTNMRFAICIQSDDKDLLTPRMIYRVMHEKAADDVNYVRVVDNEGEDYLYPSEFFVFFNFPDAIQRVLSRAPRVLSLRANRETSPRDRKRTKAKTTRTT